MKFESLKNVLSKYVVEGSLETIAQCIADNKVFLKICKPRSTKLGDYRSPQFNGRHTITVNNDLNKNAFTVTLLHELAHLICYNLYKNKVRPHGAEWKNCFINLASPLLQNNVFQKEVEAALKKYFKNPGASSCADPELYKILQMQDGETAIFVEMLPLHSVFELDNGRIFKKGEKRRTRYYCVCQHTNKAYLVSGVAKVKKTVA